MSTVKDVLCLLAIVVAYGIVGRMDYDDAVMLEEAQRQRTAATSNDCAPDVEPPPPAAGIRPHRASFDTPASSTIDNIEPCSTAGD